MRRHLVPALVCLGVAALLGALAAGTRHTAADEPKPSAKSAAKAVKKGDAKPKAALGKFMHEKLDASNQVLEGLVTEDFALIETGAATMQRLSEAEQWQVSNDAMYRQHSNQFRRVMGELQKKAKDKQLDGAALAWVEGTMSCLECHKWVRSTIIAGR